MGEKRKMNKTKVLIVSDYAYPAGGIEVCVDEIVSATKELIDYRVLTWPASENTPKRAEVAPTNRINCGDFSQILSEFEWADLLLLQSSWNTRVLASIVKDYCQVSNKPLVTVVHTSSNSNSHSGFSKFQEKIFTEIIQLSQIVIGVSDDVLDSLRSLDVTTINDSFKYRKIENASRFDTSLNKVQERKIVSFVGRPTYVKGIDLFLDLAKQLQDTNLKFKLNTVSLPPPEEANKISNLGECQWLLSDEEMIDFYDATDLLITPYRNADGLPLTILEALSRQIPIIGFDTPGVSGILHRHNQLVLASEDVGGLADAVRNWHQGKISLAPPEPTNILTWQEQAVKYVNLFEEVLSE
jgi:glycosyltransferase involved in cell wall biosynthesis